MSAFKVGDRVKITNSGNHAQKKLIEHVGKVFTVTGSSAYNGYFFAKGADPDAGGIWDDNAELVTDAPLEDQLAEAEALVASLKQQIEDVKPWAADLDAGTHVKDWGGCCEFVKVATDTWIYISQNKTTGYSEPFYSFYRDKDIDAKNFKVKEN